LDAWNENKGWSLNRWLHSSEYAIRSQFWEITPLVDPARAYLGLVSSHQTKVYKKTNQTELTEPASKVF